MSGSSIAYRPEIDGLRAVAVVSVLLFHAGVEAVSGGFLGVDVFFVISGYLITSIALTQLKAGRFSLITFYEGRARRILPALFFVLLVCCPLAWFILLPPDMAKFAGSLLSVLGFGSNVYFWLGTGYFDADAELSPLLHTWSLAVEEQYYLLFPLLALLAWRCSPRFRFALLVIPFAASLCLSIWASKHMAGANFYLLPTRIWELLLGAWAAWIAARGGWPSVSRPTQELFALAGLGAIGLALVRLDSASSNPGIPTLLPALGAVLVILFANKTVVGTVLSSRPLVGMGVISYSVYLWHQPVYAFARQASSQPPSGAMMTLLTIAALLLGYLSWRWVEQPFRNSQRISRATVVGCVTFTAGLLAALASSALWSQGFQNRINLDDREILAFARYPYSQVYRSGACFLERSHDLTRFAQECSGSDANPVLVWGDSHAAALSYGLRQVFDNVAQFTAQACPPLLNKSASTSRSCENANSFVLKEIGRSKPSRIFLHADWLRYAESNIAKNIVAVIVEIRKRSPSTRITVLGSVPHWYTSLPSEIVRRSSELVAGRSLSNPSGDKLRTLDDEIACASRSNNAQFLSAYEAFCSLDQCLVKAFDGDKLSLTAWDQAHLTAAGSVWLARVILKSQTN